MPSPFQLTGLIAAPHTPLTEQGQLNVTRIADQAELLIEAGVSGAFVCGSTGEGPSLTTEERRQIAQAWVHAAQGRLKVVVHVGHNSVSEAASLASHAQDIGADAVSSLAPSYFKPTAVEDLLEYCRLVALGAPRIPFYFYDIPSMTGVAAATAELLRRGAETIPNLHGVKYTNQDMMGLQECKAVAGGKFDIVFGVDEALLAGLAFGLQGAVGSTYNYAAPLYLSIIKAFASNDLVQARQLQQQSVAMVRVLMKYGVMRAGKAIMGLIGVECGPVRSPLKPLSFAERKSLLTDLHSLPGSDQIFSRKLQTI